MESSAFAMSKTVIEYLARAVEFAAALIIAIAAARATWQSLQLLFSRDAPPEAKVAVRLTLGRWLAVALEFELAADVLNTAVTPTWNDIEKLAAIAALRTALNYFLEKEIREESRPDQKRAEARLEHSDTLGPHEEASHVPASPTRRDPKKLLGQYRTCQSSRGANPLFRKDLRGIENNFVENPGKKRCQAPKPGKYNNLKRKVSVTLVSVGLLQLRNGWGKEPKWALPLPSKS